MDPRALPLKSSTSAIAPLRPTQAQDALALSTSTSPRGYGWALFACLFAGFAALTAMMYAAGLVIDPASHGILPYYVVAAVLIPLRLGAGRWIPRYGQAIADCAESYGAFMLIALTGATAAYPIAALTSGMHDAALQRIDAALGFDWLAWYRLVADHRPLQWLGLAAYRSIYLTPAILLGWFAWTGERAAAHRFLLTFWVAAILTLALYPLMPAIGPLSYLWHGPLPYLSESEQWQQSLIPALRAHQVHWVDLGHLRGIVSAPSFHTAAAVLYIAAAWPRRELRAPIVALNVAMLLSTPVEGTHYLADMLLGAAVAVVAILAMRVMLPAESD